MFFRFELSFDLPTYVNGLDSGITTNCVIQAMSASRVDTYINVWRSISDHVQTSKDHRKKLQDFVEMSESA